MAPCLTCQALSGWSWPLLPQADGLMICTTAMEINHNHPTRAISATTWLPQHKVKRFAHPAVPGLRWWPFLAILIQSANVKATESSKVKRHHQTFRKGRPQLLFWNSRVKSNFKIRSIAKYCRVSWKAEMTLSIIMTLILLTVTLVVS